MQLPPVRSDIVFATAALGLAALALANSQGLISRLGFRLGYRLVMSTRLGKIRYLSALAKRREMSTTPHSIVAPFQFETFSVTPVCYNDDNYGYVVVDKATKQIAVVDVGDAEAMARACSFTKTPPLILTTHYHWDHSAGNLEFIKKLAVAEVYASGTERTAVEGVTREVDDGDEFNIGSTKVCVLKTPCHTQGHVCFLLNDEAVFTGDAVFRGGCGRFFEGTSKQMCESINKLVSKCSDDVTIFNGHEYTLENLKFAAWAFPENAEIAKQLKEVSELRAENKSTLATTIGNEKATNPWFLVKDDPVKAGELRVQKNDGLHRL